jgi:hypothetical protein
MNVIPPILPRSLDMSIDSPPIPDSVPETDMEELLARADALAKKVETLADGPMKKRLQAALADIFLEFKVPISDED